MSVTPVQPASAEQFEALDLSVLRNRLSEKWMRHSAEIIPSFIAEMDLPIAAPLIQAIRSHLEGGGDLGYAFSYTEDAPVHRAFTSWAAEQFQWAIRSDQVLLFPDVMRIVETGIEQFTDPGDAIVVDIPAYPPFLEAVPAARRTLVGNPMVIRDGRWTIDFDGLEKKFRAGATGYILCNPHNPTGRVFTADELGRILRLARAHRVAVLSDEVHAPLVFPGHTHLPLAVLPEASDVPLVTAISASKGWNIAGLKCAFAVPNSPEDMERLSRMRPRDRDGVGILGVSANFAAFTAGGPWLHDVLRHLDANRRLLLTRIPELLGADVSWVPPEGTYLGWIDCRNLAGRLGTDDLGEFFLQHGNVAVSDGREYGSPGFIRINFGTSRPILEKTLHGLARAMRTARRGVLTS
ncbi:MalY/PatB family protein [Kitasatospora sp. GAS1066B]|uniref:MalY/PatB family protein n=1 Tax=Kitasatospora sp. GAS1066B TaxID=3156271 RepID=UPI003516C282